MVTYQLILEPGKLEHHQSSHDSRNIQFRNFEVTQRNKETMMYLKYLLVMPMLMLPTVTEVSSSKVCAKCSSMHCIHSTLQRCLVTYCTAQTLNTQYKWAVGRDESTFKVYVLFWVRFTLCVSNWTPECETSSTLIVYTHVHWTCTMYIVQRTCIHCIQSTWTYMCCSGVWDIPTEAIRLWQLLIFQK